MEHRNRYYFIDENKMIHSADHLEIYNGHKIYNFKELVEEISQSDDIYNHTVCDCCAIIRRRITEIKKEYRENSLKRIYNSIIRIAQKDFNMEAYWDEYGNEAVHIKSAHENWIVSDIEILPDNSYTVTLYHKNLYYNSRGKTNSRFPDYHIQWKKRISVWRLLTYISNHQSKMFSA